MRTRRWRAGWTGLILIAGGAATPARADDALQWSGFTVLRGGASSAQAPLDEDDVSAQAQLGVDWSPGPVLRSHVHLLARTDHAGTRRGAVGVAEAYVEANLHPGGDRLRFQGGALFLASSRENIDALWENPFTISSSALNTWLGEELRPIGVDVAWLRHGGLTVGATLFRGNDTLGALPAARGWPLRDDWILLGETIAVGGGDYTSVSAENDGRLGWSARAAWNGRRGSVQLTHLDNRSDGLEYGELFNWNTRFDIVGADWSAGDWTIVGEDGFGPTFLVVKGHRFVSDLRAGYLLVSRRLRRGRASLRFDSYGNGVTQGNALTAACFWMPSTSLTAGLELLASGAGNRALLQLRYGFGR